MKRNGSILVLALAALATGIGSNVLGQVEGSDSLPVLAGEWSVRSKLVAREPLFLLEDQPLGDNSELSLHFAKDVCEIWENGKKTGSKRLYFGQLTIPNFPGRSFFYEVDRGESIFRKGSIIIERDSVSLHADYGDTFLPKAFVPRHRHVYFVYGFVRLETPETSTPFNRLSRQDICGEWKTKGGDLLLTLDPNSLAFVSTQGRREVVYAFCPGETTGSLFCRLAGDEPLYVRLATDLSQDGNDMALRLTPKVRAWLSGILSESLRDEETLVFRRTE